MKRAIAFVTALVIAAGAVAPAASVFADDLPAIPINTDNLSIWDTSTSTPDNPYNTTDVFNIVNDMWADLFDDGRFNNTTVSDFQRYSVEWAITKYIEAAPDEEINGVTVSYFDDIVDYICAHPADFDIYWTPEPLALTLAGDPYGRLQLGNDFFDNLKDFVIANYYTTPSGSGGSMSIGSGRWVYVPAGTSQRIYGSLNVIFYNTGSYDLWVGAAGSGTLVLCSYDYGAYGYSKLSNNTNSDGTCNTAYSNLGFYTSSSVRYTIDQTYMSFYSNVNSAVSDFFGNPPVVGGDPVSNGKVYIRDDPLGGDTLNFSYPAYPVSNSKSVSNYYYNTYGDTWEDNSTVIDDTVYNNNLTTLYPVTYENNIPLWLIQSNSTIETFDYSLELPSAPLETLPSDFEGGGSFFQNSFVVLGGFGAFVLVGLSFSLVGLFFKE